MGKKEMKVCKSCGQLRPKYCRGLCQQCYGVHQRAGTLDKFPRYGGFYGNCNNCGQHTYLVADGLCGKCYVLKPKKSQSSEDTEIIVEFGRVPGLFASLQRRAEGDLRDVGSQILYELRKAVGTDPL